MAEIVRPTITVLEEYGVEDGSSVRATLGIRTVSTIRKLLVAWAEAGAVAKHFLGYSDLNGDGGRLRRLLPAAHPRDPSLIAVQVHLANGHRFERPEGADPDLPGSLTNRLADQSIGAVYQSAVIEVEYQRAAFSIISDGDCPANEEFHRYTRFMPPVIGMDLIALPGSGYSFVLPTGATAPRGWSGATKFPINYGLPLPDPYRDVEVRWARLPGKLVDEFTPSPWMRRLLGLPATDGGTARVQFLNGVNKTQFGSWAPGTAWLIGAKWELNEAPFVPVPGIDGDGGVGDAGVAGDEDTDDGMTYLSQYDCQEADVIFTFRVRNSGVPWNWFYYNDPRVAGAAGAAGAVTRSGWYPISASDSYYAPGSVPAGDAPKNEVEFHDLFRVTA